MKNHEYDVIICGGGPGGSTAALGFVDTNIRVAVIEKSNFPREKVCGDGVASYVPKALNLISPRFGNEFKKFKAQLPITHVGLYSFEGKTTRLPFPESWFISPRYDLDHWLYQQAASLPNVTYFLEEQVTGVHIEENVGRVTTAKGNIFTGQLIIGADGATSSVRRLITDYKMDPAAHYAAVRAYYTGVTGCDECTFEVHFITKYPSGYFWIFPSTDQQVNIGFGLPSDEIAQGKIKLRELLLEIIEDSPVLKRRFENATLIGDIKGWSIPFGYGKHPISGNRFMLIGDAASIADPSTGEGIGQAIVSGRIAAFLAKECFAQNDFTAEKMKAYDKEIHRKFGRIHQKRAFFSQLLTRHQWLLNLTIRLLNSTRFVSGFVRKMIVWVAS
jgi:geranylgeranyl reductase family protein